jgi:dihydrofolate reductase
MKCELIVACTKDGIIGYNNKIPWHIPEDLKYFRNTTLNSIVIMGRKTFESLPNGYLKNRINIVITNKKIINPNVIFTNYENIFSVIEKMQTEENRKIFIIGGSEIYKLFFDYCKTIHLTVIDNNIIGDITFPYPIVQFQEPKYSTIYKSDKLSFHNIVYQRYIYKKL